MSALPRISRSAPANLARQRGHDAVTRDAAITTYPVRLELYRQAEWCVATREYLMGTDQCALHVDSDGQLFLIFQTPQLPFPVDGIVYQDREQRYSMPAGSGRVSLISDAFH